MFDFKGLGSALALVSAFGMAVAGGIGYGISYLTADDVSFDFNDVTNAAIEENTLSPEMVCREIIKGQNSVIEEFNDRGVSVPFVTMTLEECLLRQIAGEITAPRP